MQDIGAAILVESAFDTHLEIGDHLKVEDLAAETATEMSADLAAFDRKKAEEADRMAHLFDDGEFERRRREKLDRMGADLDSFKGRKTARSVREVGGAGEEGEREAAGPRRACGGRLPFPLFPRPLTFQTVCGGGAAGIAVGSR